MYVFEQLPYIQASLVEVDFSLTFTHFIIALKYMTVYFA